MNGTKFPRIPKEIKGIVFDKDGTLLDFDYLWGDRIKSWILGLVKSVEKTALAALIDGVDSLRSSLEKTLGFDSNNLRVIPDSPLAVASTSRLYAAAMTVLYQHGLPWHTAETIVADSWAAAEVIIDPNFVRPIGDVAGTMQKLTAAGYKLAVITSDDRHSTLATLPILGIDSLIDVVVCGDDSLAVKPAPDGLWHIAHEMAIEPAALMMVGDTASDMLCGRRAGVGSCVGIEGGAGDRERLAALADMVLSSIEGLVEKQSA